MFSGAKNDRAGLLELLDLVVEGDTLVVTHIDRLSRGLTYGLQVIEGLHHAGVEFRSLAEDFDTSEERHHPCEQGRRQVRTEVTAQPIPSTKDEERDTYSTGHQARQKPGFSLSQGQSSRQRQISPPHERSDNVNRKTGLRKENMGSKLTAKSTSGTM